METQESQRLVIKDSDALVMQISAVVLMLFGLASPFIWPTREGLLVLFPWIAVIAGVWMLLTASNLIITADRSERTLRLEYRHLIFHRTLMIPLDEIENISTQKTSHNGTAEYRIVAELTDGKVVPFRDMYTSGNQTVKDAAKLRAFIHHKTPAEEGQAEP